MKSIKRSRLVYQQTGNPAYVLRILEEIEQMPDLEPSDERLCCDVWATLSESDSLMRHKLLVPYLVNLGRLLERGNIHAGETGSADVQ